MAVGKNINFALLLTNSLTTHLFADSLICGFAYIRDVHYLSLLTDSLTH